MYSFIYDSFKSRWCRMLREEWEDGELDKCAGVAEVGVLAAGVGEVGVGVVVEIVDADVDGAADFAGLSVG